MRTTKSRLLAIVALLVTPLALSSCGESSQDKAKAEVCGARADISKQVTTLEGLTLSIASVNSVKDGAEAIASDIKKIKNAEGKLAPQREEQVRAATNTFESQLSSILNGLTSSLSLNNAESELKSALNRLTTSYKQSLARVDCS